MNIVDCFKENCLEIYMMNNSLLFFNLLNLFIKKKKTKLFIITYKDYSLNPCYFFFSRDTLAILFFNFLLKTKKKYVTVNNG